MKMVCVNFRNIKKVSGGVSKCHTDLNSLLTLLILKKFTIGITSYRFENAINIYLEIF